MEQVKIKKIRKRNGTEQSFNIDKIRNAIQKANYSVPEEYRLNIPTFNSVVNTVIGMVNRYNVIDVETVQDFVEKALMKYNCYEVAKSYVLYRDSRKKNKILSDEDEEIVSICNASNENVSGDNANKRPTQNNTMRDYIAGTKCKTVGRKVLPKEVIKAHDIGKIHFHDMDYSPVQPMHNCCLANTFDMILNNFLMGDVLIEQPHTFLVGANVTSQSALHFSSLQYGGQTHSWAALVPLVETTRETFRKKFSYLKDKLSEDDFNNLIETETRLNIRDGVQTLQYQVITMNSANGQTPFISMVLNLREAMTEKEQADLALIIEEVLKQRKRGVKNKDGEWVSPLFPKLLYVMCEGLNVNEDDPYYYLTRLAAKCEVLRMQPDVVSEKKCREAKDGQIICSMGCRSFLTPYWRSITYTKKINEAGTDAAEVYSVRKFGLNVEFLDKADKNRLCFSLTPLTLTQIWEHVSTEPTGDISFEPHKVIYNYLGNTGWIERIVNDGSRITVYCKEPKTYGRWNQGVVTINLPFIALESIRDNKDFFELLEEESQIVRLALQERHKRIAEIKAENAPLLWMYGGLSRLDAHDDLHTMLEDIDYTTISYGYVGLYETCMALIGKSNTTPEGQELSKDILNFINTMLADWKAEDNIPYSIYGTPEEQTTEKFAKALKKQFMDLGEIKGVNDHLYVTNSYHVNPAEKINAFDKLRIEGQFLQLSKGGAVSYVECSTDLDKNIPAIETLFRYMYDNILYSELNFTNEDYCDNCGYHGELILDNTKDGKFLFHCPKCNCFDATKLHAPRRLCGYLGEVANGIGPDSPNANQGRLEDIYSRVKHI